MPPATVGQHYTHLMVNQGSCELTGNTVRCNTTKGMRLLWPGEAGATVTLKDNNFSGLKQLATLSRGGSMGATTIVAQGNTFRGTTTIYCKNITELNLDFDSNTLVCEKGVWFLQEFASTGTLNFTNNHVTVQGGSGELMQHYNDTNPRNYHFTQLNVTGNVFNGVNRSTLLGNIVNAPKRNVSRNSF